MRKKIVSVLAAAMLVAGGGSALAQQPESDPSCDRGQQSGRQCAGDNGGEGTEGLCTADETAPEDESGLELALDIVDQGAESEDACE